MPAPLPNIVLTFHRTPSAAWLRQALQTIGRVYRFASVEAVRGYLHRGERLQGAAVVTFDDGERSFVDVALPVLEELHTPATLFVSPGVLTGERPYWFQEVRRLRSVLEDEALRGQIAAAMGWPPAALAPYSVMALFKSLPLAVIWQVIDAARRGQAIAPPPVELTLTLDEAICLDAHPLLTVGAHSFTHPVLHNESDAESERQIRTSIDHLATALGRPVREFAYPNGAAGLDYSAREQRILRAVGVDLAFTTDSGYLRRGADPLALPRVGLEAAPREGPAWILAKLLLLPLWNRLRADREARERRRLAALKSTGEWYVPPNR